MTRTTISAGDVIEHKDLGRGTVVVCNELWLRVNFAEHSGKLIPIYPPHHLDIVTVNGETFTPEPDPAAGPSEPAASPDTGHTGSDVTSRWLARRTRSDMPLRRIGIPPSHPQPEPARPSEKSASAPSPAERTPVFVPSKADLQRQLQRKIGALRSRLGKASFQLDTEPAEQIRRQLVNLRVEFCKLLRPRSQEELEEMRLRYTQQVVGEIGADERYSSGCWVCSTPITDTMNDRCSNCGWFICGCGACKSPYVNDYGDSEGWYVLTRGCLEQQKRLGPEVYEKRLQDKLGDDGYALLLKERAEPSGRDRVWIRKPKKDGRAADDYDLDDVPF